MRRWIKRTLIGVFGASLLVGSLAACSHHRYGCGGPWSEADVEKMRDRFVDKASRELALDDAQRAKLVLLTDAVNVQRRSLKGEGADPRSEFRSMFAGAQFDRAKAQSLIDEKTVAVREKAPAVVASLGDFYDSLRPDQQQKVRDFLSRGHGRSWRG